MSLLDRINSTQNEPKTSAIEATKKAISILEAAKNNIPQKRNKPERRDFLKKVLDIHRELINNSSLDLNELSLAVDSEQQRLKILHIIEKELITILDQQGNAFSRKDKTEIIEAVIHETIGLGPLEELINDESITEIMVNGYQNVFIERHGVIEESAIVFYDDEHVKRIITRIVGKIGRRIDEGMPMVDARLKDGSRVNAIIPPIALSGPTLTIRKFSTKRYTIDDLLNFGSLNQSMQQFISACVRARLNIIVSGGTGSGKTTLLNVLSSFIPEHERIVTIEDSAELRLDQKHVITLETRPPNIEKTGEITIRDLVRNSLRMRPDRLIVGEVRGGETLDMLQAMNTGHDGSMTTAHANTPFDMISRLETMVLMAGVELPVKAIRQQIASAFDLVIQQSRMQDGTRKIVKITEVGNLNGDGIDLHDIFCFEQQGLHQDTKKVKGLFKATGHLPHFLHKLTSQGIELPPNLFLS